MTHVGITVGLTYVQQAGGGGGEETPAWMEDFRAPSTDLPLIVVDAVNEHYWDGSAEVALSSLVTLAGSDVTRTADGLTIPESEALDPAVATGALLTALATKNFTIVLEVLCPPDSSVGPFLTYRPSAESIYGLLISLAGGTVGFCLDTRDDGGEGESNALEGVQEIVFGSAQRLAVTRTSSILALSLAGEETRDSLEPFNPDYTVNIAYIGNTPGGFNDLYYIRSIAVYAPQPNADLDNLSAT